jgi:dolichol-phosphate mannosyltransferase
MDSDTHLLQASVDVALVIPTFNERESIVPLVAEIDRALAGLSWHALFVDDSTDGTDEVIARISTREARVSVLHRVANRGGLAGAVADGLRNLSVGTYACVLDADLQHPPALIPSMLAEARRADADIVVASRYRPGGSTGGLDGPLRQFYSRGLKLLARTVFPRRLAAISDPLGGYFLVRRAVIHGVDLRPIGYKILLEVLVRGQWQTVVELPYRFEARRFGASKATLAQGLRFLEHLRTLAWDCSPVFALPRLVFRSPVHPAEATAAGSSRS